MISLPHSKRESGVHEPPSEGSLTSRYGKERNKLTQAQHDGDANRGYNGVTKEKAQWAARCKGPRGSQKEASTDNPSNATM